jgi:hypothetical protein
MVCVCGCKPELCLLLLWQLIAWDKVAVRSQGTQNCVCMHLHMHVSTYSYGRMLQVSSSFAEC